ncbi:MAG: hypothetical protein F6K40_16785 [Okeania sp. SIO3I5]|uniref:hypothetical protein n=1 Tax=Okeania sp. SIO3I5 TaxID=2607805 RepID=UPI0013BB52EF|nr:hypothetical protein [Okeania sp. SIO3I5]NEQ37826.1 hypothetical protein [Okeania sp. SIO3I5]
MVERVWEVWEVWSVWSVWEEIKKYIFSRLQCRTTRKKSNCRWSRKCLLSK